MKQSPVDIKVSIEYVFYSVLSIVLYLSDQYFWNEQILKIKKEKSFKFWMWFSNCEVTQIVKSETTMPGSQLIKLALS
jgi:hypothetical protein